MLEVNQVTANSTFFRINMETAKENTTEIEDEMEDF
jgi:hypothetical protein